MSGQLHPGFTSRPRAYKELIALWKSPGVKGGEFSTCFTELQRKFIKPRPTKLKSLIRLVKHWYKQVSQTLLWPTWLLFYQQARIPALPTVLNTHILLCSGLGLCREAVACLAMGLLTASRYLCIWVRPIEPPNIRAMCGLF